MKVLSIIAQKPNFTGSGIYFSELLKHFNRFGAKQKAICAVYNDDNVDYIDNVSYDKLIFDTEELPIKIAGMSDVMPYKSIKYSDFILDNSKFLLWFNAFEEKIKEVLLKFKPDLIICHHLYIVTALTINLCKTYNIDAKIYGICHNTDLRQFKKTDLKREYIKSAIKDLDLIFTPSTQHSDIVKEIFDYDYSKIKVIGIGYNNDIFFNCRCQKPKKSIIYVGKVAINKGVLSLIRAINLLCDKDIVLDIVGGHGDKSELDLILSESLTSKSTINFLGHKNQNELSKFYNEHNIFVLPSFSEGIPIVPLEALACGCKVVINDLPGVREFITANIKSANIRFVQLPKLINVDNASDEEILKYEKRLSTSILDAINDKTEFLPDLQSITWENIAKRIYYA